MLTLKYLRYWHTRFNKLVFKGTLQKVPLSLEVLHDEVLGEVWGLCYGTSIKIRSTLTLPEARATLLHEMIHQWQYENALPMDHGRSFIQWEIPCRQLTGLQP
jgi:hypothetical protein